jgi:hypothetical protein
MKDQTLTNKNGPLANSSTNKVTNEISTLAQPTSETGAIAKSANISSNGTDGSPKSKLALLRSGTLSNAIAKTILLFGISFAGSFLLALTILRLTQPKIAQTTSVNIVTPTATSNRPSTNKLYSLVNQIISLTSFGYVSGLPEPQNLKISKNSLAGTSLGKSWNQNTAFAPATSLSAPPPLTGQPLQTISPSQLPPISFSIPPDAIPDALSADTNDSTKNSTPAAIAKRKSANRAGSSQETTIELPELPKDTLGATLTSGASAGATLVNAAVFSGDRNANSNPRFVVKLEESLKSPSGKSILPANTTLVVFVRSLSSKPGAAELEAVNVQIDGKEYDLPAGAITFLGSSGSSLIGLKYGDEEPSNSSNETANTAKKPNKSTPLDSVDNPNNSEATPSASRPSSEQVKDGNKEAIENVMRRSQFYYIPQGTPLKLVVNKTVKL